MNTKTACRLARGLDGVTEKAHFGSDAFYANKRIFATVWHERGEVNFRLTPDLQDHYIGLDGDAFSRIDNAWGRQGWTTAHLEFVEQDVFIQALKSAWEASFQARKRPQAKKAKATPSKKARKKVRTKSS